MDEARLADLTKALARDERTMRDLMAWARRRGITGPEAQRFLARQRAALKRHQQAEVRRVVYDPEHGTQSLLLCCGKFHPIHQMPLRVLCCNKVYLQWDTRKDRGTPSLVEETRHA